MILKSDKLIDNPLVSVVICTYNRDKYIRQTIESVLSQNMDFSYEIVIGDDYSTDHTKEILLSFQQKYPDKIILVMQTENGGVGRNWASAMKMSKGKYIALCDDDDYWHDRNKLKKQIAIVESSPQIGLVHTDYRTFNESKNHFKKIRINNEEVADLQLMLFQGKYSLLTSSVLFRKELIDKYVNLDDYIKLRFPLQDWNTWILIAPYTQFYHMAEFTVTYRLSDSSITRLNSYDKVLKRFANEKIMYKYVCSKFPKKLFYYENDYENYINLILLNLAYRKFDYKSAKKYAVKLKKNGFKSKKVIIANDLFLFFIFALLKKIKMN